MTNQENKDKLIREEKEKLQGIKNNSKLLEESLGLETYQNLIKQKEEYIQTLEDSPLATPTPTFKDWRGTIINNGDSVVYPSRQSSSLWMNEGTVVSLGIEPKYNWEGKQIGEASKIGVNKTSSCYTFIKHTNRISYPDPTRITVVDKAK